MEDLFPYQIEGATWLSERKCALLADEMGLGKTAQAIAAADKIGARNVLVVCPAVARLNWLAEFEKFGQTHRQGTAILSARDKPQADGLTVVSYDLIHTVAKLSPDLLILDESHFLKNVRAKRTKQIYGTTGLGKRANRVWCLSGTPAPNNVAELWTMLQLFGAYRHGYWDFVKDFCEGFDDGFAYKITGTKNVVALRALLAPIMLRRKKADVLTQLPPIRYSEVVVEATELSPYDKEWLFPDYLVKVGGTRGVDKDVKEQQQRIEDVLKNVSRGDDFLKVIDGMAKGLTTLRRYTGLVKVPQVAELIKAELEGGLPKLVVFAVHQTAIEWLRQLLEDYGAVTLYGNTPALKRDRHIKTFQTNPRCRVFIGNILAAGTAINLTSASDVLFLEADWVPANNAQAAMRCHRIGQSKPVSVRFVTLADSIDQEITRVIRRKTKDLTQVFD